MRPSHTLDDALAQMVEYAISSVVVVDEAHIPLGIFTEHDALRMVAEGRSKQTLLGDIMTKEPFCVSASLYLHDAYTQLEEHGYRHLIVVDEAGCYVGVTSEGDFLRHMGFENLSQYQRASDVMSEAPLLITPQTSLKEAAVLMSRGRSDYAIITEERRPVAIVRERDIARRFALAQSDGSECVDTIAQRELFSIPSRTELREASALIERHGIHQLIVTDDEGFIVGILSRHDVLKAIHGAYFEFLVQTIESKSDQLEQLERSYEEIVDESNLLENILTTIPDLIWLKNTDGVYLTCNRSFERFFGAARAQIVGKTDFDFVDAELAHFFRHNDRLAMAATQPRHNEEYLVFADGSYEGSFDTIKTAMRNKNGEVVGILGIARDITPLNHFKNRIETLANFDTLTGFANRSLLLSHLERTLAKARRNSDMTALLIFDLDRFKDVNDSYGHSAGDELLTLVAERFRERFRSHDVLSRLGGDEFAVVIEHLSSSDGAALLAQEMIERLSLPYTLQNGQSIHIGASVGIALAPQHAADAQSLLQYADTALYRAKNEGRGIFRYYTDDLTHSAKTRIESTLQLREALRLGEFCLYYQPQVHLQSGRIVGAEALIRWNDPKRGLVSPMEFIPLAEESGLINPIGAWVIEEACRQGKIWHDIGYHLQISLNVSAYQVRHQNIPEVVESALRQSGFSPDKLTLELTESAMMERQEEVVQMLHLLRARGIHLAIDDFGTGYSSYSYLKRFPIDVLKIDKSFIDDVPYHADDTTIVRAIVAMGGALGFSILAEEVEQAEQAEFLKALGCTHYQGYLKSRPLSAEAFEALLG
ncbi:MAG: EAL domain-containing protein [Campylobacterales bacterium]|nr:EAL domain-containing protein [Campylobacterales bacterium]